MTTTAASETRTEATDPVPETPPPAGLGQLLAPIRGRLVLAVVLQVMGSVAGVVPFVAWPSSAGSFSTRRGSTRTGPGRLPVSARARWWCA